MGFKNIGFVFGVVWLSVLSGCATTRGVIKDSPKVERSTHESQPTIQDETVSPVDVPPTVSEPEFDQIVLVFSPGWARAYAVSGVLSVLEEKKIKIAAVYATDLSGVVSALYFTSINKDDFEWKTKVLNERVFSEQKFNLFKFFGASKVGENLDKVLSEKLGDKNAKDSRVPIIFGIESLKSPESFLIEHGTLRGIARAAIGFPGYIEPIEFEGVKVQTSGFNKPYPIEEAKKSGLGPVVVVDLLSSASQDKNSMTKKLSVTQLENSNLLATADYVLKIDFSGIDFMDYSKKASIVYRGKKAAEAAILEIKKLIRE